MCADMVCHIPADPASHLAEISLVCLDIALFPTTIAPDVVLPGVIDAMECSGTFGRLGHTCRSTSIGFTDSPFEFTKSNEDTMRQLFREDQADGARCEKSMWTSCNRSHHHSFFQKASGA